MKEDIGNGVLIEYVYGKDDVTKIGIVESHAKPDGTKCSGLVWFDCEEVRQRYKNPTMWQVNSLEPLTLSPSILCECGHHGYIRDGKWVPA